MTDEAIERIKEMIVTGALQPGDRLPREDELAARLGCSRSSLREAVRALTLVRVLDVRQGDGTYVTSLDPALLLEAVSFVVDLHRDDSVLDFLEVRRMLEPAATAIVARSATDEQLAHLEAFFGGSAAGTPEEVVSADQAFHRAVVSLSGNRVLVALLESLSGPMHRARVWRGVTDSGALERTWLEHRGILDAIARHDPELARARSTAHIAGLEDWLRRAP